MSASPSLVRQPTMWPRSKLPPRPSEWPIRPVWRLINYCLSISYLRWQVFFLNLGISKLQVNTDSQFLIKCVTEWMPKWRKNGWKLSTGGDVKNREQLTDLHEAMEESKVQVKWVGPISSSDSYCPDSHRFFYIYCRITSRLIVESMATKKRTSSPKPEQPFTLENLESREHLPITGSSRTEICQYLMPFVVFSK